MKYQLPEGLEFHGKEGGIARFSLSMPVDEDGYYGRHCPRCAGEFRVKDYDKLEAEVLYCVYCGHEDPTEKFSTQQQATRANQAIGDWAEQWVSDELDKMFRGVARRSRHISYSPGVRRTTPRPLPGIDEQRIVRERTCGECTLAYAVFNDHRFCPQCGQLTPLRTAMLALETQRTRIELMLQLPDEQRSEWDESGATETAFADAVKSAVTIVEVCAERIFNDNASNPAAALKGKGKIFQRLRDLATLFDQELQVDLRGALGDVWNDCLATWEARHVLVHRDGIVDEKYLARVPSAAVQVGGRLRVSESDARAALSQAEAIVSIIST